MSTLALLLTALLSGCASEARKTTNDTTPPCTPGYHEEDDTCVPEACGTGTWGTLEVDASTVYVSAGGTGDGSSEAPFGSIQQGLDATGAAGGGLVAVAAGTYHELLDIDARHAGIHLAGRCRELVVLDVSAADAFNPGVEIEMGPESVELSGLTVQRAGYEGIAVRGGEVTLRDVGITGSAYIGLIAAPRGIQTIALSLDRCALIDNLGRALVATEQETAVTLRDTTVQGTLASGLVGDGMGVQVGAGAALLAERCSLGGNTAAGLLAEDAGTEVTLIGTTIRGTHPDERGDYGYGIAVSGGAHVWAEHCELADNVFGASAYESSALTMTGCLVSGSRGLGVTAIDPDTELTLRSTVIQDIELHQDGIWGYGLQAALEAELTVEGCTVSRCAALGLCGGVSDGGGGITLVDTTIEDTRAELQGEWGFGIQVYAGAALRGEGCILQGNTRFALMATEAGTSVVLRETSIRDTLPLPGGKDGYGVLVQDEAELELTACEITRNHTAGLIADLGSQVRLQDSWVTDTRQGNELTVGIGLVVERGASLEAVHTALAGNQGPGLLASSPETRASLDHCTIEDNQFAGVITGGAELVLSDSVIQGTTVHADLGGGSGLYAFHDEEGHAPSLALSDSVVRDNPIAGVWLDGPGSYQLSENTIHGGEGWTRGSLIKCGDAVFARDGVQPWDGDSGLLVEGNILLDGLTAGLFLDEASATLSGNRFMDNSVDLIRQGSACDSVPEGYHSEPIATAELCPTWDYGTCPDDFDLLIALDELEGGRGRALLPPPPVQPRLAGPPIP